ncbi:MAG: hypothetical protein A4E72_00540 [Syntrophus sp. PtaU1.Bin208]|nr:MAG: hypothetical protein A4E72_00540 [Syntrophus sp. PtaU1.Bin208]
MVFVIGLPAGKAGITGIEAPLKTVERLGESQCEGAFPDALHSMKEIGMGETVPAQCILQGFDWRPVTENILK